jgi:serine/threonine protein kinase
MANSAPKLSSLKFLVSSILGTSGNSTVMMITDKEPGGGRYALKVLKREEPADDLSIERARAECEASAKLSFPEVLKVYDFRLKKSWFKVSRAELLMEYVDGKPMSQFEVVAIGPGVLIFQKAAGALAHMHRRGVFHGDLRPSKIMLAKNGAVKVRGYGLSGVKPPFRDQFKPNGNYAAPEQSRDKTVNESTDVYNLGATMYHILTGRAPGGVLGRVEGKKLMIPSAINPRIPNALNNLLVSCLQSAPDRRPSDMYEVVTQLEAISKSLSLDSGALAGLAVEEE